MMITVIGNRPQFIKMAPISAEIARRGLSEYIVHTGQHYDDAMSDVFFREMNIPSPHVQLALDGKNHAKMTAEMMVKIDDVVEQTGAKTMLIYGDTNSTLAATLVAVKRHMPIAHVEAGPRTYDKTSPEEVNRVIADYSASLRFCPDEISVENLARETMTDGVMFTGDLMYDSYLMFAARAAEQSDIVSRLGLAGKRYALMTSHRPNNTDSAAAIAGMVALLEGTPMTIVFAVHPRTKAALTREGMWEKVQALPNVIITGPLGYIDMLAVLESCEIVLTDSGGLQKEGFFAGKPVLNLFYLTPWPNIEANGWIHNTGCLDVADMVDIHARMEQFRPTSERKPLFGDGTARVKVVDALEKYGFFTNQAAKAA